MDIQSVIVVNKRIINITSSSITTVEPEATLKNGQFAYFYIYYTMPTIVNMYTH